MFFNDFRAPTTRRRALRQFAAAATGILLPVWYHRPGAFAEELTVTSHVGEGPFYPDKLPLDTDNDLLIINDAITPAVGEITYLSGRVLSKSGSPIRNAFVEIWQVDSKGVYIHTDSASGNEDSRDTNFQGYGRFLTDIEGRYYFRTVKPVPYPGRTPHIHIAVSSNGKRILTTQLLLRENKEQNEKDGLFRQIRDPKLRESILVDFEPIEDSKLGELKANFDIVLGVTPEELQDGTIKGGISIPDRIRRG